ncbi:hypothetical protein CLU79DRAFT_850924, partial [Phycomyces nitens]
VAIKQVLPLICVLKACAVVSTNASIESTASFVSRLNFPSSVITLLSLSFFCYFPTNNVNFFSMLFENHSNIDFKSNNI